MIDLHGRIVVVRCTDCEARSPRDELQNESPAEPGPARSTRRKRPMATRTRRRGLFVVRVPPCRHCGGVLKPDVVFFGENVPRDRVDTAFGHLDRPTRCSSSARR